MRKASKSQWDFGELFPTESTRRVLTVSELTTQVKRVLEKQMGSLWVSGEISNLRTQSSGHIYFTLKDAASQLSCVLFRKESVPQRDLLQDGQKVLLQGDVTVYEARGQYQLLVRAVELQGVGALQLKFEQLKQRLAAEGLFTSERKRPMPAYPQRIGLVTSPTGAAIRDVLHVVQRRNPSVEIIFVPCRVQGEGAAIEIAAAIRLLNEFSARSSRREEALAEGRIESQSLLTSATTRLDLILVTRGGGSLEDLWAFNEEAVARAIQSSEIPVVSAVGHEIDFTIADFVADVRAATPSAAAEIITEGVFASRQFVTEAPTMMNLRVRQKLAREQEDFESVTRRMLRAHPRRRLDEQAQRLDELQSSLLRSAQQAVLGQQVTWQNLATRLLRVRPGPSVKLRRERLGVAVRQLREQGQHHFGQTQNRFQNLAARLRLLGPEQVLARGYSLTLDAATGAVLRDATKVKPGQRLKTRLKAGEILSRVEI